MKISVIIPAYNEAGTIGELVKYLFKNGDSLLQEVIVSDGGSSDDTVAQSRQAGALAVHSPAKGRGAQMNYGASLASGDVYYFVHADTLPPVNFAKDILKAVHDGFDAGRYKIKFNSGSLLLKINAWFSRFDSFLGMGGDHTLFIVRTLFNECNGFKSYMKIMEEYEFCERMRKHGKYKIMDGYALVSARKYGANSWLQVQKTNLKIVKMYNKGASQQEMVDTYQQMLTYRKNAF